MLHHSEPLDLHLRLIPLLAYASLAAVFLLLAAAGTSYQRSVAKVVEARVRSITDLCEYEGSNSTSGKRRGVRYEIPCDDSAKVSAMVQRGYKFSHVSNKSVTLKLQADPLILTNKIMSKNEAASLTVGSTVTVWVPKIRSGEAVELSAKAPRHQRFWKLFAVAAAINLVFWGLFGFGYSMSKRTKSEQP